MGHAYPDPGSSGSDTGTLPSDTRASQAPNEAAIEAYIARAVARAPKRSDAVLDHIAVLLRPRVERTNATPVVSTGQYRSWELKRYENAGQHGYYTADGEAA